MISFRPLVYPPLAPPSALPSVPVMMSIAAHDVVMFVRPAAALAHEADGVRIVHHHHRVVFVGQIANRRRLAM